MKIKEYAANVSEYTEVVDAPYNHKGDEEVLDERPVGFIKGGLQKLGAKVLPGSLGAKMGGKVDTGKQANQLYQEYHTFLGRTGDPANSTSLKAFLQQKGINVDVDSLLGSGAPPAAAPTPAATEPVAESIDNLNRMLVLAGRQPKKMITETKNVKKKKILTEEVALNRSALNKVFMQIAQKMAGSSAGAPAAGGGGAPSGSPAPAGGGGAPSGSPAPAGGGGAPSGSPAPAGGGFGGEGPAAEPASGGGAPSGSPAPAGGGGAPPVNSPTVGGGNAPSGSPAPAGGGGIINRIKGAFKGNPAAGGGGAPSGSPAPAAGGGGAPSGSPAPAGGSGSPSGSPTPAAGGGGKLGGTNPGAAAAKAAGSQKQSTQNMNDYVKNVSAQINAAQTKPEKIELAKELINFMSDRKGSPEYDNAMGSAKAVLKKAGLNNMLAPLGGGQTANQKPQGLRNPPAAPKSAPKAQPTPAAAQPAAAPAPAPETPAPRAGFKVGAKELNKTRDMNTMFKSARGLAEDRVLHRNSYIFIKKVLENTDLTLRDLGYRVSISESTSDSVTLIPR